MVHTVRNPKHKSCRGQWVEKGRWNRSGVQFKGPEPARSVTVSGSLTGSQGSLTARLPSSMASELPGKLAGGCQALRPLTQADGSATLFLSFLWHLSDENSSSPPPEVPARSRVQDTLSGSRVSRRSYADVTI